MDKQILVNIVEKLELELKRRGWQVTNHRIMSAYAGFRSLPLLIGIVIPAMENISIGDRVKRTVPILHDILTPDEHNLVSGLLIYSTPEEMNQDMDEREGVGRPVVEPYWPD
jgi:hypothetical protein